MLGLEQLAKQYNVTMLGLLILSNTINMYIYFFCGGGGGVEGGVGCVLHLHSPLGDLYWFSI